MDAFVSAEQERRRQGQIFGTADELRVLRTLNARANAMRRMAGNKHARQMQRLGKARAGSRVA
jgi:hypothetical protein